MEEPTLDNISEKIDITKFTYIDPDGSIFKIVDDSGKKIYFDPYGKEIKRNNDDIETTQFNALQLYQRPITSIPKLIEPFFQKVGLAALVGESDCGKSTFLTQLALNIALGNEHFLNFKINSQTNKVIYVSTEDDPNSLTVKIKKQLKDLESFDEQKLKNLDFIFNTEDIYDTLKKKLKDFKRDLIVIDAFSDVFTGEINSSKEVRNFLNKYHSLANANNCLIVMLHHVKKGSEKYIDKKSIIGSQSFEAKMRSVVHLSPYKNNLVKISITKGNFIGNDEKDKITVVKFKDSTFIKTDQVLRKSEGRISQDKDVVLKVKEYYTTLKSDNKFNSVRDVVKLLEGTQHEVKSTVVGEIIKTHGKELKKMRESILSNGNSFENASIVKKHSDDKMLSKSKIDTPISKRDLAKPRKPMPSKTSNNEQAISDKPISLSGLAKLGLVVEPTSEAKPEPKKVDSNNVDVENATINSFRQPNNLLATGEPLTFDKQDYVMTKDYYVVNVTTKRPVTDLPTILQYVDVYNAATILKAWKLPKDKVESIWKKRIIKK